MSERKLPSARVRSDYGFRIELVGMSRGENYDFYLTNIQASQMFNEDARESVKFAQFMLDELCQNPECFDAIRKAVKLYNRVYHREDVPDPALCPHNNLRNTFQAYNHGDYIEVDCKDCGKRKLRSQKIDNMDYKFRRELSDRPYSHPFLAEFKFDEDNENA